MTKTKILQQLFAYFGKYPDFEGVMKNFQLEDSASAEYVSFKSTIVALPEKSIFPELKDFVFGATDDSVKKKVEALEGMYMFLDYGAVLSQRDTLDRKTDAFDVAVTLASTNNGENNDPIEELLTLDKLLTISNAIISDLRYRRKTESDTFVRMIDFPVNIIPFSSAELHNSYGWTVMFKITGTDIM